MNGSENNHTVSPNQARNLVKIINEKAATCKSAIESKTNDFFGALSGIWADNNATDFANDVSTRFGQVFDDLAKEGNALIQKISKAANDYAQAGNKSERVNPISLKFSSAINPKIIQNTFDGDKFGFADEASSAQQVEDLLTTLKGEYIKSAQELVGEMQKANAFGNISVKADLVRYAKNISDRIDKEIEAVNQLAKKKVAATKASYRKVSAAAGGSNSIGDSTGAFDQGYADGQSAGGILAGAQTLVDDTKSLGETLVNDPKLVGEAAGNAAKDLADLGRTAISDPKLFGDAFKYSVGEAAGNLSSAASEFADSTRVGWDIITGKDKM